MPKVRSVRNRTRQPPEGWDLIEPTIEELDAKMREAETESHEGKRRTEALWPIFKIHHQRSRYIFDLFYKRKAISRELYDYCIKNRIADASLIAKWKKQGKPLISVVYYAVFLHNLLGCLQATKICAACAAFRLVTPTLAPTASAVFPARSSKRAATLSSAFTAAAEAALVKKPKHFDCHFLYLSCT